MPLDTIFLLILSLLSLGQFALLWFMLRETLSVQIVRRHKGEWLPIRYVSQHSSKITEALNTAGMAVIRNGKIEEGIQ